MALVRVDAKVTWPTASGPVREPAVIEIIQADYAHEMVVLTYYVEPHTKQRYREGSPITIRWGYVPNALDTFYGTVLYVKPHLENEKHTLRVVCIGTTYPFKDVKPAVAIDQSVEQVLRTVVIGERLDLIRERSGVIWPMLVRNADETGWAYLTRLAKRVGYVLCPNKTAVACFDPVRMLTTNRDSFPTLHYHYGRGNDFRGEIITFTPEIGDQGSTDAQREQRLMSVDPRTAEIIGVSSSGGTTTTLASVKVAPKFTGYLSDQPVHSLGDAAARVRGKQAETRWTYKASMEAYGNVRVRPGRGVHIVGVSKESDGLWYVHKVRHTLSAQDSPQKRRYFMQVDLRRDSREADYVAPPAHRAQRSESLYRRMPTPILAGGRWVSPNPVEVVLP